MGSVSEKEASGSTVYTRTLALAAQTLGSVDRLAQRLVVEEEALQRWIAGTEFPPHEVFMKALDIVADGPLYDATARRVADKAQQHADRLQANANRARESAERVQRSADRAQQHAERTRKEADRTDPAGDSGRFRQVKAKDGAPASNTPDEPKKKDAG